MRRINNKNNSLSNEQRCLDSETEDASDEHAAPHKVINGLKRLVKILSNILFNSLLICITHSPIAPLVFAGILLGLYTLFIYKFNKTLDLPTSTIDVLKNLSTISPFILPPLILIIPAISTPLTNMSSLYAWAFIGISTLICYSYKKFNTPKQASVDGDTWGNELPWHSDLFQSDAASSAMSSSASSSNSSFVSTRSTEDASENTQTPLHGTLI